MKIQNFKKQKGQSLVESALVIPLILLLIFTFLDLGRGIYYYSALGNAVREGARLASVTPVDEAQDKDPVFAQVGKYSVAVQPNNIKVCYPDPSNLSDPTICEPLPSTGFEYVKVSASYIFTPITPFLAQILGTGSNTITLNAESSMRLAPIARQ